MLTPTPAGKTRSGNSLAQAVEMRAPERRSRGVFTATGYPSANCRQAPTWRRASTIHDHHPRAAAPQNLFFRCTRTKLRLPLGEVGRFGDEKNLAGRMPPLGQTFFRRIQLLPDVQRAQGKFIVGARVNPKNLAVQIKEEAGVEVWLAFAHDQRVGSRGLGDSFAYLRQREIFAHE